MQLKKIIVTGLLLSLLVHGFSQKLNPLITALKIGDQVPDVQINNLINYKSTTVKFSDFRGKLLILDFWATWCAPCIAAFPKLDSLQKKFDGKIQILPVTMEKPELVAGFLKR